MPGGSSISTKIGILVLFPILILSFQNCGRFGTSDSEDVNNVDNGPVDSGPIDSGDNSPTGIKENSVRTLKLNDDPHSIDILESKGATRAIVFLHGGGGSNIQTENNVGLNSTNTGPTMETVNWKWLNDNKIVAVFPQGQAADGSPKGKTWTNHAMLSGQDDVAFLKNLASYIRNTYGIQKIYLAGHSMGGVMTNRMWCESSETFDAYITFAGPASAYYADMATPCSPSSVKPYMGIIGSADSIMQNSDWVASQWMINPIVSTTKGFENPYVIGEWVQHQYRSNLKCGTTPALESKVTENTIDSWSSCNNSIKILRVKDADHGIASIQDHANRQVIDILINFVDAL